MIWFIEGLDRRREYLLNGLAVEPLTPAATLYLLMNQPKLSF